MDSTAIKLIQDTAVKAAAENVLGDGEGTKVAVLLQDGESLESMEQFQPGRRRFRGKFQTNSIADFMQYVKAPAEPRILLPGFIDADKSAAVVFFNLGTEDAPGHGDWTATLQLKPTAAYAALLLAARSAYNQKGLIEFIEDWHPNLRAYNDVENGLISLAQAVSAIRKVTIKTAGTSETTVGNMAATRSTLEDVEARGAGGLPTSLVFTAAPYLGFASRAFVLRVQVLTTAAEPTFKLRLFSGELHNEEIAQEFKSILFDGLQGAATLTVGTFAP